MYAGDTFGKGFGKGYMTRESNARPKYWTDAWGDICPKCNGTGDYNCGNKSKADCICPRCNGSGVISNESKEDDIDWTEDKPEGDIPFYCPLCGFTIEEKATYDGVFQHNKQLHDMNDEDAETLAKGFTYSNSPPTSTEGDNNGV